MRHMLSKICLTTLIAACAVTGSFAGVVTVDNAGFELPAAGKVTSWDTVPGWTSSGTNNADSGVDTANGSTEGDYAAYLKGADDAAFNLTGQAISAGEMYTLSADVKLTWNATTASISLFYDDGGTHVPLASLPIALTNDWVTETLVFTSDTVPAAFGNNIGIEINNTTGGGDWMALDNVQLLVESLEPVLIAVAGNGASISNGDTTPSLSDDTDFGAAITSSLVEHIFTINSPDGTTALGLTGTPVVEISGDADFTISVQAASSVPVGGNTTFTVQYVPTSLGSHTATISIANDVPGESPFTFDVTGTGVATDFTLNYSAGANGSVTGTLSQVVSFDADGSPVGAVPASGYVFTDWSDGSTENPRTDLNVTADVSVTASFAESSFSIAVNFGNQGDAVGSPFGILAADWVNNTSASELSGISVAGATVTWESAWLWRDEGSATTDDESVYDGYLDDKLGQATGTDGIEISVSGLTSAFEGAAYNITVYGFSDNTESAGAPVFQLNGGVMSTGTVTLATGGLTGNYLITTFTNVSADNFTVAAVPLDDNNTRETVSAFVVTALAPLGPPSGTPVDVVALSFNGASNVITWVSESGASYNVLGTDNLVFPDWQVVAGPIDAPLNSADLPLTNSTFFYKVEVD